MKIMQLVTLLVLQTGLHGNTYLMFLQPPLTEISTCMALWEPFCSSEIEQLLLLNVILFVFVNLLLDCRYSPAELMQCVAH